MIKSKLKNTDKKISNSILYRNFYKDNNLINKNTLIKKIMKKLCQIRNKKYNTTKHSWNIRVIDDIIYNEKSHLVSIFKDYLIYDDNSEFMKRFYFNKESIARIPKIVDYYINNTKILPNYSIMEGSKMILKGLKKKQKLEKQTTENKEIVKSKHKTINSQYNNERVFTEKLKESIENIKPSLSHLELKDLSESYNQSNFNDSLHDIYFSLKSLIIKNDYANNIGSGKINNTNVTNSSKINHNKKISNSNKISNIHNAISLSSKQKVSQTSSTTVHQVITSNANNTKIIKNTTSTMKNLGGLNSKLTLMKEKFNSKTHIDASKTKPIGNNDNNENYEITKSKIHKETEFINYNKTEKDNLNLNININMIKNFKDDIDYDGLIRSNFNDIVSTNDDNFNLDNENVSPKQDENFQNDEKTKMKLSSLLNNKEVSKETKENSDYIQTLPNQTKNNLQKKYSNVKVNNNNGKENKIYNTLVTETTKIKKPEKHSSLSTFKNNKNEQIVREKSTINNNSINNITIESFEQLKPIYLNTIANTNIKEREIDKINTIHNTKESKKTISKVINLQGSVIKKNKIHDSNNKNSNQNDFNNYNNLKIAATSNNNEFLVGIDESIKNIRNLHGTPVCVMPGKTHDDLKFIKDTGDNKTKTTSASSLAFGNNINPENCIIKSNNTNNNNIKSFKKSFLNSQGNAKTNNEDINSISNAYHKSSNNKIDYFNHNNNIYNNTNNNFYSNTNFNQLNTEKFNLNLNINFNTLSHMDEIKQNSNFFIEDIEGKNLKREDIYTNKKFNLDNFTSNTSATANNDNRFSQNQRISATNNTCITSPVYLNGVNSITIDSNSTNNILKNSINLVKNQNKNINYTKNENEDNRIYLDLGSISSSNSKTLYSPISINKEKQDNMIIINSNLKENRFKDYGKNIAYCEKENLASGKSSTSVLVNQKVGLNQISSILVNNNNNNLNSNNNILTELSNIHEKSDYLVDGKKIGLISHSNNNKKNHVKKLLTSKITSNYLSTKSNLAGVGVNIINCNNQINNSNKNTNLKNNNNSKTTTLDNYLILNLNQFQGSVTNKAINDIGDPDNLKIDDNQIDYFTSTHLTNNKIFNDTYSLNKKAFNTISQDKIAINSKSNNDEISKNKILSATSLIDNYNKEDLKDSNFVISSNKPDLNNFNKLNKQETTSTFETKLVNDKSNIQKFSTLEIKPHKSTTNSIAAEITGFKINNETNNNKDKNYNIKNVMSLENNREVDKNYCSNNLNIGYSYENEKNKGISINNNNITKNRILTASNYNKNENAIINIKKNRIFNNNFHTKEQIDSENQKQGGEVILVKGDNGKNELHDYLSQKDKYNPKKNNIMKSYNRNDENDYNQDNNNYDNLDHAKGLKLTDMLSNEEIESEMYKPILTEHCKKNNVDNIFHNKTNTPSSLSNNIANLRESSNKKQISYINNKAIENNNFNSKRHQNLNSYGQSIVKSSIENKKFSNLTKNNNNNNNLGKKTPYLQNRKKDNAVVIVTPLGTIENENNNIMKTENSIKAFSGGSSINQTKNLNENHFNKNNLTNSNYMQKSKNYNTLSILEFEKTTNNKKTFGTTVTSGVNGTKSNFKENVSQINNSQNQTKSKYQNNVSNSTINNYQNNTKLEFSNTKISNSKTKIVNSSNKINKDCYLENNINEGISGFNYLEDNNQNKGNKENQTQLNKMNQNQVNNNLTLSIKKVNDHQDQTKISTNQKSNQIISNFNSINQTKLGQSIGTGNISSNYTNSIYKNNYIKNSNNGKKQIENFSSGGGLGGGNTLQKNI